MLCQGHHTKIMCASCCLYHAWMLQWQAKGEDKHASSGKVPAREGVIRLMDEARADRLLVGVHGNRTGAVRCNDDNTAGSDESVLRLVPMPHLAWF